MVSLNNKECGLVLLILHAVVPSVSIIPNQLDLMLHTNATITCHVMAKPLANIKWWLNGRSLNETARKYEINFIISGNCNLTEHPGKCVASGTITIFNFVPLDSGTYSCIGHNIIGNETQSTILEYSGKM